LQQLSATIARLRVTNHPLPLAKPRYFSILLGLLRHVTKSADQLEKDYSDRK